MKNMRLLLGAILSALWLSFSACGDGGHFLDVGPLVDLGEEPADGAVRDTGTSTTTDGG